MATGASSASFATSVTVKLAATALSSRRQFLVLTYHRVLAAPDPLLPDEVDATRFEQHIRFLAEHFRVLPLTEAVARLRSKSLPRRALCITMDDGYATNCEIAMPILRRYGVTGTCFVASGFVDGEPMWNDVVIEAIRRSPRDTLDLRALSLGCHSLGSLEDRRRAIDSLISSIKYLPTPERAARVQQLLAAAAVDPPESPMMSAAQVRALHDAGVEIGAHTVSHPILAGIDADAARREIEESRERLTEMLRAPVHSFAYPNGKPGRDYHRQHVDMVRNAGYGLAVSTAWGVARAGCDLWQLPRLLPWDLSPFAFGLRLARTYAQRRADVA